MKHTTFALLTLSLAVHAGEMPANPIESAPATVESGWKFRMEPYAWLTALEGDVGVLGQTAPLDAGFDDVWDVLDFAAALQLEARNGRWGIIADGFYADLSQSFTPPTGLHTNGTFEMQQFLGELYATYRFAENPCGGFLDAYAGLRYNYLSIDLSADAFNPIIDNDIDASRSKDWVDPIIGLRGQWNFNDKWFIAGKGDIGGFDFSSEFAWSLQATLGCNLTDNVFVELGYRLVNTEYEDGGFTYDIEQDGLYMGFSIRF